ncbi:hypothetical protein [Thiomicrorhabdus indica]|uniref:hypothetical protein n=1 Tax=Thiomicrorhabdus indica TaxID=2267253 RepID=UPI002AA6D790|nr:hypothetical protein [Thiomicrorhabdus indica]
MERVDFRDYHRRLYKKPTDIEAANAKLKTEDVKKTRRLNDIKERLHEPKESWDALEEE